MSISLLFVFIALSSVAAYFLTKLHKVVGAIITIFVPIEALVIVLMNKNLSGGSISTLLEFEMTQLGYYFTIIMLIIYSCVAFFHPYWMKKIVHPAAYNFLFLLSLAGTIGVFFSTNFIALFICLEVVVWASMFIIPFGKSRKAAIVYYAMSAFGSFSLLYAIFLLYSKYQSFDISFVLGKVANDPGTALIVFILIAIAGLVKLGVFPFHIWLPMAHGNAPDTFSPILSGGLVKVGAFVAFLVVSVLPSFEAFSSSAHVLSVPLIHYILMVIGAISIVVGTLLAIRQEDAKKLLAYSSVANGGYILIGILVMDAFSMSGAMIHIFAHGLASAAAFLAIAAVSYRTGTTKMSELGGMIHRMPLTFLTYLIAIISMAGIPPMVGFISKWLLFQSIAKQGYIFIAAAMAFGSIGSFLYVFRPLSAVFLGQLAPKHEKIKEVPWVMQIPMIVLSLVTLFYGIYPYGLVKLVGKVQASVGIDKVVVKGTEIIGTNGVLDPVLITAIFGLGFVIALIMFLLLPKSRKVGLMDTYTAAEFIYTPELYHYAHNFYAPFERLYEKHPSIVNLYKGLVERVKDVGKFVNYVFFSRFPSRTVLFIVITLILLLWGEKI